MTIKYGEPAVYQLEELIEGGIKVTATQWVWVRPEVEIIMQFPSFTHNEGSLKYLPPGSLHARSERRREQAKRDAESF
ncbi:hypothetical protein C0V82_16035 [Niveispirillum cyanobacteriorum]|uniref:Uncharacterized protein n=1 Tax=Niveispirillum cyanobacteriorum TaxID=1612173 RepID=A0A2K9NFN6_9PROT|nr:hypothetical protein C0V82_16035 [Niveispirillum cyanobacteriorum]